MWNSFMPKRKDIRNVVGTKFYSIEMYDSSFFDNFNPDATFKKWAAVEVNEFQSVPKGMEKLTTPEGLYAVFLHQGPASDGPKTYQYIFNVWLPDSGYILDNRPHFAIMGERYKNNSPDSEEELWIPVKNR